MKNNILENIHTLKQIHADGLLGGEVMPEDVLINLVKEDELLDVLTMAMALNYQRNSYSLWESVVKAYQDPKTSWIFNPIVVATKDIH